MIRYLNSLNLTQSVALVFAVSFAIWLAQGLFIDGKPTEPVVAAKQAKPVPRAATTLDEDDIQVLVDDAAAQAVADHEALQEDMGTHDFDDNPQRY
jgi:hypothetical protein